MSSRAGRTATFRFEGHKLSYSEYGDGPRTTVLIHGLLLSKRMHRPLAEALAARGNHVVTIDLLGHGRSDRPAEMWNYGMPYFARQIVALLDHLGVDEAVIAGTSLGANVTLETAVLAPERVRGTVIEMPVLDNALLGCALAFTPLMLALTVGEPAARVLSRVTRLIPNQRLPFLLDIGLGTVQQDPKPSAGVLQGLFFQRVAPPREERRKIQARSLVIGHRRDPVHPFSDSGMLVDELPNARLLEADSILELRIAPERLTDEISEFVDECWKPRAAPRARRAS
jgi:pimeloyl-ACP methyl ester carboxylesterase